MPSAVISTIWITPSRVDDEGAAVGQAGVFAHHAEVAGDGAGRVADHRRTGSCRWRPRCRATPCGVKWVSVETAVDLDAQLLELGVVVGQVLELGRAHEGEVGRVEEHDRPLALALQVGVGDVDELALLEGGGRERLDLGVDEDTPETP